MNLESQVCSLELAKQLKSLGVPQESLFYWLGTKNIFPKEHLRGLDAYEKNY